MSQSQNSRKTRQRARLVEEADLGSEVADHGGDSGTAAAFKDARTAQQVPSAKANGTRVTQPVIIEFCCEREREVGKVKGQCMVFRITKQDCDVTTTAGAEEALQVARDNPGALLFT